MGYKDILPKLSHIINLHVVLFKFYPHLGKKKNIAQAKNYLPSSLSAFSTISRSLRLIIALISVSSSGVVSRRSVAKVIPSAYASIVPTRYPMKTSLRFEIGISRPIHSI